ncbi:hypothetical protein V9T40_001310 [Parthenolecanium corni]|uniref:Uncharacterized protein n=1 Tax=Parthenolecanium corni TaxID=536013 RepID=A0AAN9TS33_9HEMI
MGTEAKYVIFGIEKVMVTACITSAVEIYYPNDSILIRTVNNKLAHFVERPSRDILTFSSIILQTIGMS